jgi:hypothetical protein
VFFYLSDMSISKSQAAALADGFLDSIGSTKEGLRPRETFSELILIAGEMVEDMQNNLNASNSNASGRLSESIEASEPEQSGSVLKVDIFMNFYGRFVNSGVRGTKSGSGIYAFKTDFPSKSMVEAIREWANTGKLKISNVNKAKTISANEKKNATIAEIDNAYAVARSIKQHGIKPTGFLDKAVATTQAKVAERLGLALKVDVLNAIIP